MNTPNTNPGTDFNPGTPQNFGTSQTDKTGVVDDVKHKAGEVLGQAQQKAAPLMDEAQQKAKSKLDQGKEQAAVQLGSVAQALHKTGDELQQQDQKAIGQFTSRAADSLDQFSNHLRETNVRQLMGEVEEFARRERGLFLGTAFALGILGARFLKSSKQGQAGSANHSSQRVSPEALALPETVEPLPNPAPASTVTPPSTWLPEADSTQAYRDGAPTVGTSATEAR